MSCTSRCSRTSCGSATTLRRAQPDHASKRPEGLVRARPRHRDAAGGPRLRADAQGSAVRHRVCDHDVDARRGAAKGARVYNDPRALRDHSEKFAIAEFSKFIAPTLVSRSPNQIQGFIDEHARRGAEAARRHGRRVGVPRHRHDPNRNVIIETLERPRRAQRHGPALHPGDRATATSAFSDRREAGPALPRAHPEGRRVARQPRRRRHGRRPAASPRDRRSRRRSGRSSRHAACSSSAST